MQEQNQMQEQFFFGDWIKNQREIRGLSQEGLSLLTNRKIKQSTISMWENKRVITPSIENIWIITNSFGMSLSDVPWDSFYLID